MPFLSILAAEILPTNIAANVHLALDLMLKQRQVILAVHVTEAAPLMVFILVSLHVRLLGEAPGAVSIRAGNLAVELRGFGKLACVHGRGGLEDCW